MTYYIMLPGDDEPIELGDVQFNKFWTAPGWGALNNIVANHPLLVDKLIIKNEKGDTLSVEEFLKEIQGKHMERE